MRNRAWTPRVGRLFVVVAEFGSEKNKRTREWNNNQGWIRRLMNLPQLTSRWPKMNKQTHMKRIVLHSILILPVICLNLFMLILGSGIFPILMWVLFLEAISISILFGICSSLLRKRIGIVIRCGLIVLTFILTGQLFMLNVRGGLREAKAYGDKLAEQIVAFQNQTTRWPQTIDEIPNIQDEIHLKEKFPYLYFDYPHNGIGIYDKIGGLFISYRTDQEKPKLSIARRGYGVIYDWKNETWTDIGTANQPSEVVRQRKY